MEELGAFAAAIFAVVMFVAAVVSSIVIGTNYSEIREDMESVGIERFVRCNNSQSNWVEIVWKEKK